MPRVILTTCGTSLLTSNCWKGISSTLAISQYASPDREEHEKSYRRYIAAKMNNPTDLANDFDINVWNDTSQIAKLSAELASLRAIQKFYEARNEGLGKGDELIILHSDADERTNCAKVVKSALEQFNLIPGVAIVLEEISGLDPANAYNFGKALGSIWEQWKRRISKDASSKFIFNLVGGYKGTAVLLASIAYKFHSDTDIKIFYYHEKAAYENIIVITFNNNQFKAGYAEPATGKISESFGGPIDW